MEKLSYRDMQRVLMDELRLMHYPIAIKYFFDQGELDEFKARQTYYQPAKPLTFCQAELGARMSLCSPALMVASALSSPAASSARK